MVEYSHDFTEGTTCLHSNNTCGGLRSKMKTPWIKGDVWLYNNVFKLNQEHKNEQKVLKIT